MSLLKPINELLQLISYFESRDFFNCLTNSEEKNQLNDESFDVVTTKLKTIIAKLEAQAKAQAEEQEAAQAQLKDAFEFITALAKLDFSKTLPILGKNEIQDGLATGLNMLSEELKHSAVSRAELEEKNILIENILDNIPVAVFLKDANDSFRIKIWNKAAEEIFGLPRELILERTTHDLFPKEEADLYLADDIRVTKKFIKVNIPEEPATSTIKRPIVLHTQKVPITITGNNDKIFLLGISEDISERKSNQQQILESSKMATLGELSSGLAHEINNPLAIILSSAELLPRYINDHVEFSNLMTSIAKNGDRISKIIKSLNKYSNNSRPTSIQPHALSQIVKEAKNLTSMKLKRFKTELLIQTTSDSKINCDEIQIEQVLINLINNAIDANKNTKEEERWVKVEVFDLAEFVVLRVSDSGKGIPENIKSKLFDPFFTTKKVGEGTGLGLSICKGILNEHNATISVISNLPNTCFEICFLKC